MKKIAGTLALAFVIYIAFLQFCGVSTVSNFSVAGYFERLEQIEPMPDLPSIDASFSGISDESGFFSQVGAFFSFLGDVISYPFRMLIWFFKTAHLILFTDNTSGSWTGGSGGGTPSGGGGFGGGGGHSW